MPAHTVDLARTVRLCINDDDAPPSPPSTPSAHAPGLGGAGGGGGDNSFAGAPAMRGLGRYYELTVRCRGVADPVTGYFLNIKVIDRAVRGVAVPIIARACRERPSTQPAFVLAELLAPLNEALGHSIVSVAFHLTPYHRLDMSPTPPTAVASPPLALMRQQFDFAAAHRLHAPGLSDAANRETFGKCNNPRGHGHNYRLEPCVEFPVRADGGAGGAGGGFTLVDLERVVARTILDRFDHTHLNEDTPEFDQRLPGGLNPSVENIARVFFDLLAPAVAACGKDARLRHITVWETDKTSCTYPAASA